MRLLRGLVQAIGILTVMAIAGCLFMRVALRPQSRHFDFKTMDAIVAKVRAAGLKPEDEKEFELENLSDPNSLRPSKPDGSGWTGTAGHVWAQVTADGHLKVVICTSDRGHFGMNGFAYSEIPLPAEPWNDGGSFIDVPGPISTVDEPDGRIDAHWWEVYDNNE